MHLIVTVILMAEYLAGRISGYSYKLDIRSVRISNICIPIYCDICRDVESEMDAILMEDDGLPAKNGVHHHQQRGSSQSKCFVVVFLNLISKFYFVFLCAQVVLVVV